jgi:3-hydroxyacyl-CoA dehydrogenase
MTTPVRSGAIAVIRNGLMGQGRAPDFAATGHGVRLTGRAGRAWIACVHGAG